ncbi:tripartite tricarboxylate transporter substrate binding protein [Sabulicella rubraurantiaca]|uniref:tripartite tricarboxylate transporter substrate binding protein n=1 Tax=Sabulicella rubraurantiaca TaxID=2811429 RepID=UPI001A95B510|nr:tripartite tricarboxylate transporter substrate binding protein [Sabulicella rubraurantiaca]
MIRRRAFLTSLPALAAPLPLHAQLQRPLRLVVSSAPGASLDALARILSPSLSARLGVPVVVENQGGANGLLAAQAVLRAEPDGSTLLLTGDAILLAGLAQPQAGVSLERFAPAIQAVSAAQIIATHPGASFTDIEGYVAAVRARPGALNVAIPAQGGIAQVVHALLARQLGGLSVEFLSFRGGGPAMHSLLARDVDALVITLPAITEQVRNGAIRPLAVTTAQRDEALPEVPTLAETVAPGFDVDSWQGVLAPPGTPELLIRSLHDALAGTLAEPAVAARLRGLGFRVTALAPEAFRERAAGAAGTFGPVIRDLFTLAQG